METDDEDPSQAPEVVFDDGSVPYDERFFHETNLLRIEGRYFSFGRKHRRPIDGRETYVERLPAQGDGLDCEISFDYDPRCGRPGITAYKLLQAALKRLSDYGRPAPQAVMLAQPDLLRLMGRDRTSDYGRTDTEQLQQAVRQLRKTDIRAMWYDKYTGRWLETEFSIINATSFLGETEHGHKRVTLLTLEFAPLIIRSLENGHFTCFNYRRIEHQPPITVALYKRLFYHFSNIYGQFLKERRNATARRFVFRKNYADICAQWLGGLTVLQYQSKILKEQLGPHFRNLKATGLVASVKIEKNKDGSGFNLLFRPGREFFVDYAHYYDTQLSIPFQQTQEEAEVQKPLQLVRFFYAKLLRLEALELDEKIFDTKEFDFAREVLEQFPYEEARRFVEFSIKRATETGWDLQTFRGCRMYLPAFHGVREALQKEQALDARRRAMDEAHRQRQAYEKFCREALQKLHAALSPEERKTLEDQARATLPEPPTRFKKSIQQQMQNMTLRAATNKLLGERLPSFEEWQRRQPDREA